MFSRIREQITKLSGTRRFAAGALSLYIVGWLTDRTLTLFWETVLEKQAPEALAEMSDFLANDLTTGMAIMASLALFVPPVASFIFDASARFSRHIELQNKRLSRRDYIYAIANEAIALAQQARKITTFGRWDNSHYLLPKDGETPQQSFERSRRQDADREMKRGQMLQTFVTSNLGRARFLYDELVGFGYEAPKSRGFDHITNLFCVEDMANTLETAAHKALSDLKRDGYPISEAQPDQTQLQSDIGPKTPQ